MKKKPLVGLIYKNLLKGYCGCGGSVSSLNGTRAEMRSTLRVVGNMIGG